MSDQQKSSITGANVAIGFFRVTEEMMAQLKAAPRRGEEIRREKLAWCAAARARHGRTVEPGQACTFEDALGISRD